MDPFLITPAPRLPGVLPQKRLQRKSSQPLTRQASPYSRWRSRRSAGDDAGGRPTKARNFAAEPRWGRRKARDSSPPRTPPWGRWGPSWASRPSCPCRCRGHGPPRRALGHGDRSRGRRPSDTLPAHTVRVARAATAFRGTPGQTGGGTNPEFGIESHLRRWPAPREGIGARGRLASLSRSVGGIA